MKKYHGHKGAVLVAVKAAGNPSSPQLAAINAIALKELTEDEVYVRTAILSHSGIDRDSDAIEKTLLDDFAKTLPGKGLFIKHPGGWDGDSGPGVGRWFETSVKKYSLDEARRILKQPDLNFIEGDTEAYLLEASYFIPRSEKNADLIADIDAGVASDVSIGFAARGRTAVEGIEGKTTAWRVHAPGEALEGSLVWLGAQPGAHTVKAAGQQNLTNDKSTNTNSEDDAVDLEEYKTALKLANEKIEKQTTEIETLKTTKTENPDAIADAKNFKGLMVVAGTEAEPADVKAATTFIEAGKAYISGMVDVIVAEKRRLKVLGDDQKAIDDMKTFLSGTPIAMLEAEHAAVLKNAPKGSQLEGGEPNASGGEEEQKGLRDSSVTQKALGVPESKAA